MAGKCSAKILDAKEHQVKRLQIHMSSIDVIGSCASNPQEHSYFNHRKMMNEGKLFAPTA